MPTRIQAYKSTTISKASLTALKPICMFYVYVLRSESRPDKIYIGVTKDLKRRFYEHNAGQSTHTAAHRPWRLICYIGIHTKQTAYNLEQYLKSGSGREFIRKRLA